MFYLFRHITSNRKKLLESVFVAVFVAIINLTSMILLNNCQTKLEMSSFNAVHVRNMLKLIQQDNKFNVSLSF